MSVTRALLGDRMRMLFGVVIAITVTVRAEPIAAQTDAKGEWPQFLGPQRNGRSSETGLLDGWPEQGPKEVWRVSGGVGMSGLAISRGRVLTLVDRKSTRLNSSHSLSSRMPSSA